MGTSDAQPLPYEEEEERLGRSKAMVAGEGVEQDEAAKAAISVLDSIDGRDNPGPAPVFY